MRIKVSQILAGGAVYAGVTWATYNFFSKPKGVGADGAVSSGPSDGHAAGGCGCAFDRLASVYDSTVGSEETYMMYGLMRWWLLRDVKGDVLEMSAGTGRNLPHYRWAQITSLTLADVSAPMLRVAEDKYFDDLKLNVRQPGHKARFVLADAERMVAADGEAPEEVLLRRPRARQRLSSAAAAEESGAVGGNGEQRGTAGWGFWKRRPEDSKQQQQQQQQEAWAQQASALPAAPEGTTSNNPGGPSPFASIWRRPKSAAVPNGSSGGGGGGGSSTGLDGDSTAAPPAVAAPLGCPCSGGRCAIASSGASVGVDHESGVPLTTFAPQSFDAVVDTFGLCSCDDPVKALRQAAALVRPGGRLVLLEHGRSSYEWLNERMDAAAAKHREKWGCWWNRDIEDAVNKAGLQVESSRRWHFGTTYLIVARPPALAGAAAEEPAAAAAA